MASERSVEQFREAIRTKTRRTNGRSLATIVAEVNPIVRGWFGYFKHSHRTTCRRLDQWVRMRLRSILRRRHGGKGRGRGLDHQCWPNAYFAQQGVFTMTAAFALARQPR